MEYIIKPKINWGIIIALITIILIAVITSLFYFNSINLEVLLPLFIITVIIFCVFVLKDESPSIEVSDKTIVFKHCAIYSIGLKADYYPVLEINIDEIKTAYYDYIETCERGNQVRLALFITMKDSDDRIIDLFRFNGKDIDNLYQTLNVETDDSFVTYTKLKKSDRIQDIVITFIFIIAFLFIILLI